MAQERKVRVLRSARSIIEENFGSVEGSFEAEMAKMAQEMALFRSNLILGEGQHHQHQTSKCLSTRSASSYSSSTRTSSTSSTTAGNKKAEQGVGVVPDQPEKELNIKSGHQKGEQSETSWLDGLNSPLIKDSDCGRILQVRFDVRPYEPEQIVVKTVDNLLMVHAKLEQKGPKSSMRREYNREFLLPEGTKLELIRSSLSADGVLTVEAPLPSP